MPIISLVKLDAFRNEAQKIPEQTKKIKKRVTFKSPAL